MSLYHEGSRRLQDRFDTRRLADRLEEHIVHETIDGDDRAFIESCDMFFIATADADGRPQCSYKGGAPGFVQVVDERTIAFPNYDGNGMYLTAGNAAVNPHVGILFVSFEAQRRMRLNGTASHAREDPLLGGYPEAQFVTRVAVTQVFPNCGRYVHRYRLVERSRFVPREDCAAPVPSWKRLDSVHDALPEGDRAYDPDAEVIER
jgi:predicted pyridoxine 5'-phosphate oxidase superfamily flavin-nucleotide-binding protein